MRLLVLLLALAGCADAGPDESAHVSGSIHGVYSTFGGVVTAR